VTAIAIAAADAIAVISQAGALVPPGLGPAAGACADGAGADWARAAGPGAGGSEAPEGTPSRVKVAVSCAVARSHPVACSGWLKPCCPGGV
jgi:hypothetical protein